MELWVRSQSKQTLIKVEKIFTEYEEVYATTNSEFNKTYLGKYKTKERALEVLDEIQNLLMPPVIIIKNIDTSVKIDDDLVYRPQQNAEIKPLSNAIVYEMPKE